MKKSKFLGHLPGALELKLNWYEIGEGEKIIINCGTHGGEITYWIAKNIYLQLKEQKLSKKIVIIPHANPIAWMQRVYSKTLGKFNFDDGKDWNRNFPGSAEGSLAEKICHELIEISSGAELLIDLHTSRDSIPFSICNDQKSLEIAKKIGIKTHYLMDGFKSDLYNYTNTLTGAVSFPSVTIECGAHDSYKKDEIQLISNGIIKFVQNFDNTSVDNFVFKKLKTIRTSISGFVDFMKLPGDYVKQGDLIAKVFASEDLDLEESVYAEYDCRIIKKLPSHICWLGDELFQVAVDYQ